MRWGEQLDIQPITSVGTGEGELTDQKVAGYVAKYATKRPKALAPWTGPSCAGVARARATTPKEAACAKAATVEPLATTTSTTLLTIRTPRP